MSSAHGDTTQKCLNEHPIDQCACDAGPPCAGEKIKTIKKNQNHWLGTRDRVSQ